MPAKSLRVAYGSGLTKAPWSREREEAAMVTFEAIRSPHAVHFS